jgi:hypothetical protein
VSARAREYTRVIDCATARPAFHIAAGCPSPSPEGEPRKSSLRRPRRPPPRRQPPPASRADSSGLYAWPAMSLYFQIDWSRFGEQHVTGLSVVSPDPPAPLPAPTPPPPPLPPLPPPVLLAQGGAYTGSTCFPRRSLRGSGARWRCRRAFFKYAARPNWDLGTGKHTKRPRIHPVNYPQARVTARVGFAQRSFRASRPPPELYPSVAKDTHRCSPDPGEPFCDNDFRFWRAHSLFPSTRFLPGKLLNCAANLVTGRKRAAR